MQRFARWQVASAFARGGCLALARAVRRLEPRVFVHEAKTVVVR